MWSHWCVHVTKRRFIETFFVTTILRTSYQCFSKKWKNHDFLSRNLVSCLMYSIYLLTLLQERTNAHTQSGNGACWGRTSCTVHNFLSFVLSKKWTIMMCERFDDCRMCLTTHTSEIRNPWLVHIARNQQINGQLQLESLRRFHHSLMGQLLGSHMMNWLRIEWILHNLTLENEGQHWTDL